VTAPPCAALDVLVADRRALATRLRAATVTAAYRHPNGFAKLVLASPGAAGLVTRLHAWEPGTAGDVNPHTHRFPLASTVLCGALVDARYAVTPGAPPHRLHRYDGSGAAGTLRASPGVEAYVALAVADVVTRLPGDRCALDRDVIHAVRPRGDALTATLVVHPPPTGEALVYSPPGVAADRLGGPLPVAAVRALLTAVAGELERPP
jgi:hypothetical protein